MLLQLPDRSKIIEIVCQTILDAGYKLHSIPTKSAYKNVIEVVPPLKAGDCELCGPWDSSLIDAECPACREKYHPEDK